MRNLADTVVARRSGASCQNSTTSRRERAAPCFRIFFTCHVGDERSTCRENSTVWSSVLNEGGDCGFESGNEEKIACANLERTKPCRRPEERPGKVTKVCSFLPMVTRWWTNETCASSVRMRSNCSSEKNTTVLHSERSGVNGKIRCLLAFSVKKHRCSENFDEVIEWDYFTLCFTVHYFSFLDGISDEGTKRSTAVVTAEIRLKSSTRKAIIISFLLSADLSLTTV